jgi:hypothetical protein
MPSALVCVPMPPHVSLVSFVSLRVTLLCASHTDNLFRLALVSASRTLSDCLSPCALVHYVPHVLIVHLFWHVSVFFFSHLQVKAPPHAM